MKIKLSLIVFSLAGLLLMPNTANAKIDSRIINGKEVAEEEYLAKWQSVVALVPKGANPLDGQYCAGTLISETLVLTAAHCVQDMETGARQEHARLNTQVITGLRRLSDESQSERINVHDVYTHPKFDPKTLQYDVAVIRLQTPSAKPYLTLAASGQEGSWGNGVESRTAYVSGWGAISAKSPRFPDQLYSLTLPIQPDSACPFGLDGKFDPKTMMCAGVLNTDPGTANNGLDSCQGDSGGSLLVSDNAGDYKIAGIVSWGQDCASKTSFGVYTRAYAMSAWVQSFTLSGGPSNLQPPLNLQVTNITPTDVRLSWQAPVSGVPTRGYVPVIILDIGYEKPYWVEFEYPKTYLTGNSFILKKAFLPNLRYRLGLRSVDTNGSLGEISNIVSFKMKKDITRPTAPKNVRATKNGYNRITLKWNKSFDNDRIRYYLVQAYNGKYWKVLKTSTTNSVTIGKLKVHTPYLIRVIAMDESRNMSIPSKSIKVWTK